MNDLHSNITIAAALGAAVYSADPAAAIIDLQGYNSAEIVLSVGVGGIVFTSANKVEFVLSHSDDGSTFTPVDDGDLLGVSGTANGIIKSLVAAQAAATVSRFGYKGGKRYIKLLPDFSGTHATGTAMAANVILGDPASAPTDNQT
jgi:hypothetical protein